MLCCRPVQLWVGKVCRDVLSKVSWSMHKECCFSVLWGGHSSRIIEEEGSLLEEVTGIAQQPDQVRPAPGAGPAQEKLMFFSLNSCRKLVVVFSFDYSCRRNLYLCAWNRITMVKQLGSSAGLSFTYLLRLRLPNLPIIKLAVSCRNLLLQLEMH